MPTTAKLRINKRLKMTLSTRPAAEIGIRIRLTFAEATNRLSSATPTAKGNCNSDALWTDATVSASAAANAPCSKTIVTMVRENKIRTAARIALPHMANIRNLVRKEKACPGAPLAII